MLPTGPAEDYSYKQSIINLFKSKPFILLLLSYGEIHSLAGVKCSKEYTVYVYDAFLRAGFISVI